MSAGNGTTKRRRISNVIEGRTVSKQQRGLSPGTFFVSFIWTEGANPLAGYFQVIDPDHKIVNHHVERPEGSTHVLARKYPISKIEGASDLCVMRPWDAHVVISSQMFAYFCKQNFPGSVSDLVAGVMEYTMQGMARKTLRDILTWALPTTQYN